MDPRTIEEIIALFRLFDLDLQSLVNDLGKSNPSIEEMNKQIQLHVKHKFRKLAVQLHPDKTPQGTERFKQLSSAYQWIKAKFYLRPQPPPQMRQIVIIQYYSGGFYGGSTNSTTSTSTFF